MNLSKIKKLARSLSLKRNTKTIYIPVDNNIYFDGLSYRVRIRMNNTMTSKNFRSHRDAINFRNQTKYLPKI